MWEVGHFQRDCKYDGDKPTDSQQTQEGQVSFDSYDPVVGKWMTNLVATTAITAKAMKSLYAEFNRQKDLKQSCRRKYKDLQAVVTTTTEPHVSLQQPVVATRNKVNASPQVLKAAPKGQGKKLSGKGKGVKPQNKGKKNIVKASISGAVTSACPSNLRSKLQDQARVTMAMIQELTDEQGLEAMQASDLEQEDSEDCIMDAEEQ